MIYKQSGVTLIELMLSMVLSLTVIAGISSLFLQMQKSGNTQRALSYMMDDSRYIQEILQKEIRRTGSLRSRSDTTGSSGNVFLAFATPFPGSLMNFLAPAVPIGAPVGTLPEGEYIKGTKVTYDELMIRYQLIDDKDLSDLDPANTSSPCTKDLLLNAGEDPAVDTHVVTLYLYLSGNTLYCQARRDWIDPAIPGVLTNVKTQAATQLVGNVQQMNITYGVDSDADHAADYYTDAASVPAASWKDVVSLRLSLVLKSESDNLVSSSSSYEIDGTTVTPSDKRLYRVFSTVIALRNQL